MPSLAWYPKYIFSQDASYFRIFKACLILENCILVESYVADEDDTSEQNALSNQVNFYLKVVSAYNSLEMSGIIIAL